MIQIYDRRGFSCLYTHPGRRLRDADLSGLDLTEANLIEFDLRGVDFSNTNLTRADLRLANLEGAKFNQATLEQANLAGANLLNTDFCGARFDKTVLRVSSLSVLSLSEQELEGIVFEGGEDEQ